MILIYYIPVSNHTAAENLAAELLERKLIACANIFPITSMFISGGQQNKAPECALLVKTTPALQSKLSKALEEINPSSKQPCYLHWTINSNDSYESWVKEQTSAP